MQPTPPNEGQFLDEAQPVPRDAYYAALRRHMGEKGVAVWPPRHLERQVLDEIAKHGEEEMKRALARAYVTDRPARRERRRRERAARLALKRADSSAAHG